MAHLTESQCYLLPLRSRSTMMLSSSTSAVPTVESMSSNYFQSALRNLNASFNIPTVVKLKKKKVQDGRKPIISMQDLKTIFSQVCIALGTDRSETDTFFRLQTEVIYNFNNHFLQTIHERLSKWHYEQTIADIFLSVVRLLSFLLCCFPDEQ